MFCPLLTYTRVQNLFLRYGHPQGRLLPPTDKVIMRMMINRAPRAQQLFQPACTNRFLEHNFFVSQELADSFMKYNVHQFKHTGVKPTAIYTAFMHVYITPEF
jgi:hypothetical protein